MYVISYHYIQYHKHIYIDLGHIQTWCPGSALGHGHQCERSILVLPVQKLEHSTQVRALSPKVL